MDMLWTQWKSSRIIWVSLWVHRYFLRRHTESWSGHGNTAFHRSLRTCYARLLRRTHAAAALPMSFGLDLRIFVLLLHTSFLLLWLTSHFLFYFLPASSFYILRNYTADLVGTMPTCGHAAHQSRIQPQEDTRGKQLEAWQALVLGYAKHNGWENFLVYLKEDEEDWRDLCCSDTIQLLCASLFSVPI